LDGRFEYANKAFCELVGYTADELRETTWQAITHPDDVQSNQNLVQKVLGRELPHYTLEKRFVRKDGTLVWVSLFGNFVFDDAGNPVQGVAAAIDISEHRRTETALRASEERFRDLANHIDQLVWTCDELGQATWYNDRWYEYTGLTFEATRGDGWR